MIILRQSAKLLLPKPGQGETLLKVCEYAARNCYASQDKMTDDSCFRFIKGLIDHGHEAPLEFASLMFDITTSRAVLAEITRHRLASFCVESQRYIQEAETGDISFILPEWADLEIKDDCTLKNMSQRWLASAQEAENAYCTLIGLGAKPEQAREVLPNCTACRIIMKANLREWRNIFKLRCAKAAYPQMRSLAQSMLEKAHQNVPVVFADLYEEYCSAKTNE